MRQLLIILFIGISLHTYAYTPSNIRFHCSNDTIKINTLLIEGKNSGLSKPNDLMLFYGEKLLGTPYIAHTLEGEKEDLTINIDELDCTTFVETLIALTKSTLDGRLSWRDYANNLESIRYRKGIMDGYGSRLHYISEWIMDNTARGNVREITMDLPRSNYEIKTLNFMTNHLDSYPALKDSVNYSKVKKAEIGFRSHRYPIIKKNGLLYKDMRTVFKDGDIIAITTKMEGLDVSHMGIIKIVNGAPHLLHASSKEKKVTVAKEDLGDMLAPSKNNTGVRVIRVID